MQGFKESIIVPKESFLNLIENKQLSIPGYHGGVEEPQQKKEGEGGNPQLNMIQTQLQQQQGGGKKKKKKRVQKRNEKEGTSVDAATKKEENTNMYSDPEYVAFLQEKRRKRFGNSNALAGAAAAAAAATGSLTNSNSGVKAGGVGSDLVKLFPSESRFKVYRILRDIEKNPEVIQWNPQTLELITFGEEHPNSNIIDIISYLIGMNTQAYVSENKFVSAFTDGQVSMPLGTEHFLQGLQHILGAHNNLAKFTIMFDPRRVGMVKEIFENQHLADEIDDFKKNAAEKRAKHLVEFPKRDVKNAEFAREHRENIYRKRDNRSKRLAVTKEINDSFGEWVRETNAAYAERIADVDEERQTYLKALQKKLDATFEALNKETDVQVRAGLLEEAKAYQEEEKDVNARYDKIINNLRKDQYRQIKEGTETQSREIKENTAPFTKDDADANARNRQLEANMRRNVLSKHAPVNDFAKHAKEKKIPTWSYPEQLKEEKKKEPPPDELPANYLREILARQTIALEKMNQQQQQPTPRRRRHRTRQQRQTATATTEEGEEEEEDMEEDSYAPASERDTSADSTELSSGEEQQQQQGEDEDMNTSEYY